MRFQKNSTRYRGIIKKAILAEAVLVLMVAAVIVRQTADTRANSSQVQEDYIKWVDFNVSYEALCAAYEWDVDTHESQNPVDWVELLAYTAAKSGGEFDKKAVTLLKKTAEKISNGETTLVKLTDGMKYYDYYMQAYDAVLGGMVGEFQEEETDENGRVEYKTKYGLKAYFPLAYGFDYTHYDDFGAGRSFGYKRKHLGHDMMGQVGTPMRTKCRTWRSENDFQVLLV